jgi:hypothetical protein
MKVRRRDVERGQLSNDDLRVRKLLNIQAVLARPFQEKIGGKILVTHRINAIS